MNKDRLIVKLLSLLLCFNLVLSSVWPVVILAQMECDPAFGNFCDWGSPDSGSSADFSAVPQAEESAPEVAPEPVYDYQPQNDPFSLNYDWEEPSQTWQEPAPAEEEPAAEPTAESEPQSQPVNTDPGSLNYGQPEPVYDYQPQNDPFSLNYDWEEPSQTWDVFTDAQEQDDQIREYQGWTQTQAAQYSDPDELARQRGGDQPFVGEFYGLPWVVTETAGNIASSAGDTASAVFGRIAGTFDQEGNAGGLTFEQQQDLAKQGRELVAKQEEERKTQEAALAVSDEEKVRIMAQVLNLPPDSSSARVVDNLDNNFNKIGAKIAGTPSKFTINWDPPGLAAGKAGQPLDDPFFKVVEQEKSKCEKEGKSGQELEKCMTGGVAAFSLGTVTQAADSWIFQGLGAKAVDFVDTVRKAVDLRAKAGWNDNNGNNPWAVAARNGDSATLATLAEANDVNIKLLKDLKDHPEKIAEFKAADRKPYISGLDWSALGTDAGNLDQVIAGLETQRDAALTTLEIDQKRKDIQTDLVVDGGMVLYGGAAGEMVLGPVVKAGGRVAVSGARKVSSLLEKRSAGALEEAAERSLGTGGTNLRSAEAGIIHDDSLDGGMNVFQKAGQWAQRQIDNARGAVNLKQVPKADEVDAVADNFVVMAPDQQRGTFLSIIDENVGADSGQKVISVPTQVSSRGDTVLDKTNLSEQLGADYVGEGFYGMTFVNKNDGVLTKVFKNGSRYGNNLDNAASPEDLQQIAFMSQYGGQAGIPKLTGILKDTSGQIVGFQQEFIPDAIPFKNFVGGTLTQAEADEAVASLARIHKVTGSAHGDLGWGGELHGGNVMIQTVKDAAGNPVRRVRFIDFAGVDDLNGELKTNRVQMIELDRFKESIQKLVKI